ncbi:MAG: aromatic amino acid transport family protein [bacterium]
MMQKKGDSPKFEYLEAVFLIIGTIIGAGIFGVPYVISKSGILPATLLFFLVAFVILLVHLFYGEIIKVYGLGHRLVGYTALSFGKNWGKISGGLFVLSVYGALLTYVLLGGLFLKNLLLPLWDVNLGMLQVGFWCLGALLVFAGKYWIERVNVYLSLALIVIVSVLAIAAMSHATAPNFTYAVSGNFWVPFGVFLFALLGTSAIPEAANALGKKKNSELSHAIIAGTLVAVLFTFLFGVSVVGLNGPYTTPEALLGMSGVLGQWVLSLGAAMGILAVTTSFLAIALNLEQTYIRDWKIKQPWAYLLTFVPVLAIYLIGANNLIRVMSVTGGIFGGLLCIAITLIYLKLYQKKPSEIKFMRFPKVFPYFVIVAFALGIIMEIASW